jgi:hypothetical protein
MIDSNAAIASTFRVAMDTFKVASDAYTLAQCYNCTCELMIIKMMHMVWCNTECDDAMPSNFSGLSKNARYQQQHWYDLIKQ